MSRNDHDVNPSTTIIPAWLCCRGDGGKGKHFYHHASSRESSPQLLSHSAPRSKISIARASGRASWQADYCAAMQCLLPVTFLVMATPAAGEKICVYIVFVYLAVFASSALMLLMMKKSHIVYISRHDWQHQQWRGNIVYLSWKFLHRANLIPRNSTETYIVVSWRCETSAKSESKQENFSHMHSTLISLQTSFCCRFPCCQQWDLLGAPQRYNEDVCLMWNFH